jgi:hypothetical protein
MSGLFLFRKTVLESPIMTRELSTVRQGTVSEAEAVGNRFNRSRAVNNTDIALFRMDLFLSFSCSTRIAYAAGIAVLYHIFRRMQEKQSHSAISIQKCYGFLASKTAAFPK